MDQEKIGNLIKKLRKENNLTQNEFALKYGVTYQAVSKWENGKNMPDILLLKQICSDYNLNVNDFLSGNFKKKKSSKKVIILLVTLLFILALFSAYFILKHNDNIVLDKLSSSCEDFVISGSIAYNNNKASIKIEDVTYCGSDFDKEYDFIMCTLYETNNGVINKIDSVSSSSKTTLNKFLNEVKFDINNYSKTCKEYGNDNLYIEVSLKSINSLEISHKIPLKLDNCSNKE